jgi:hypothetical protein
MGAAPAIDRGQGRKHKCGSMTHQGKRKRYKFRTSVRDLQKIQPTSPILDGPSFQANDAAIHREVRVAANLFRQGQQMVLEEIDDEGKQIGLNMMRLAIAHGLSFVICFCKQNMDYRLATYLPFLSIHADHIADLARGVQVPYLLMAPPSGRPEPSRQIARKAACIAARDWLQRVHGLPARHAILLILERVKVKKSTLDGWGKPAHRDKMKNEIAMQAERLRCFERVDVHLGGNGIGSVLDRLFDVKRKDPPWRRFDLPACGGLQSFLQSFK